MKIEKNKKEYKYHFLYKTICITTGKYYYGLHSTNVIEDDYLGSGTYLWKCINKHGKENFKREILKFFNTREELIEGERILITKEVISNELCLNLTEGGNGGYPCINQMKYRSKCGRAAYLKKLRSDPEFAKSVKLKISEKVKQAHKDGKFDYTKVGFANKKHKKETLDKISEANKISQKGERNSQFGTTWIYNIELQEQKKIKKEELQNWLDKGWKFGRNYNITKTKPKNPNIDENGNKIKKIWIFNENLNEFKIININDLEEYTTNLWIKRSPKNPKFKK
jgi:hypothetical protein